MSKKSVTFLIVDALESLPPESVKKFKRKLCERDDFNRRAVDSADEMDLADLLVSRCGTESKAAQLTIELFNSLGCVKEAKKLEDQVLSRDGPQGATGGGAPSGDGSSAGYTSKYMIGGEHFIDKHRTSLTERITAVEPILDRLLNKKIITQENYTDIRCLNTSYKKMRELFEMGNIRCSLKGKDCLYEVLMEAEPFVMEDLKERS
ncbi:apoptosis-associated speck-like protein containing a CARD [Sardina pilchardus]|uniref:apoptosis-associated speck-like protein containing a CARD n=1 Tax=Sardina pilchardus TaxID=27697 RepID=UPI002E141621